MADLNTEEPPQRPPINWRRLHNSLKEWQIYLTLVSIAIAITILVYSYQNYQIQKANVAPLIVANQISLRDKGHDTFSYHVIVKNIGGIAHSISISLASVDAKQIIPLGNHPLGNPLENNSGRDLYINPTPISNLLPVLMICMEYYDSDSTRYERQLFYNAAKQTPQQSVWSPSELSTEHVTKLVAKNYCNQVWEHYRSVGN
jgi:hypothetical protein